MAEQKNTALVKTCVAIEISRILELRDFYAKEGRTNALAKIGKEWLTTASEQFAGIAKRLSSIIGITQAEGGTE